MKSNMKLKFIAELKRFQNRTIDLASFQKWISDNFDDLEGLSSPGLLMRLKRGGEQQAMRAVVSILPSCSACSDICKVGAFIIRQEHSTCLSQIAQAVQKGTLVQIARPDWFKTDDKHFGPDGYYKCNICDAVWTLVLPEREDNGLWERIA